MKIVKIKTYSFSELNQKAKERALDLFRESQVEDLYWAELLIEDMCMEAEAKGIEFDHKNINWDLYDRMVQVRGTVDLRVYLTKKYPEAMTMDPFKRMIDLFESGDLTFRIVENEIIIDEYDMERENETDEEYESFLYTIKEISDRAYEEILVIKEETMKSLVKEHDYLTSDESIGEFIEANEYDFTVEGDWEVRL